MTKFDHRLARRIYMRRPAVASLEHREIEVVDLSATGFGVRHAFPLHPGDSAVLAFRWGKAFALECVVVRCRPDAGKYRSGLRIERPTSEYEEKVAEALAQKLAEEAKTPSAFAELA
jgi:hypothetical protein